MLQAMDDDLYEPPALRIPAAVRVAPQPNVPNQRIRYDFLPMEQYD